MSDLSCFTAEQLIDAIIRLTHQLHSMPECDRKTSLRDQRLLARRELLTRLNTTK